MLRKAVGLFTFAVLALLSSVVLINHSQAQEAGRKSSPVIPKTWTRAGAGHFQVPLADPAGSPRFVPSEASLQDWAAYIQVLSRRRPRKSTCKGRQGIWIGSSGNSQSSFGTTPIISHA